MKNYPRVLNLNSCVQKKNSFAIWDVHAKFSRACGAACGLYAFDKCIPDGGLAGLVVLLSGFLSELHHCGPFYNRSAKPKMILSHCWKLWKLHNCLALTQFVFITN